MTLELELPQREESKEFKREKSSGSGRGKKNRHRLQIFAEILEVTKQPTKKTWLMYRCNLSFPALGERLEILLKGGLVREFYSEELESRAYLITTKGQEFLFAYEKMMKCLSGNPMEI